MSVYIRVELQRQIRDRFGECCAYCQTAEFQTAMTFEFEHIIPLAVGGELAQIMTVQSIYGARK